MRNKWKYCPWCKKRVIKMLEVCPACKKPILTLGNPPYRHISITDETIKELDS